VTEKKTKKFFTKKYFCYKKLVFQFFGVSRRARIAPALALWVREQKYFVKRCASGWRQKYPGLVKIGDFCDFCLVMLL
jgi:hypothetical protein